MRRSLTSIFACLLLGASVPAAHADPVPTGKWEYQVSWNGIPAASAEVLVHREGTLEGPVYRVEAAAETNDFIDFFWRLRSNLIARFDPRTWSPLGYEFSRKTKTKLKRTEVTFNDSVPFARGSYHRNDKATKVIDVMDDSVLDPVTAAVQALQGSIAVGDVLTYDVFTGRERYFIELAVDGEETVTVPAGTYATWRVRPRVWRSGVGLDDRLREATIWVAQTPLRMPVRIYGKIYVGAVNCDLARLSTPSLSATAQSAPPAPKLVTSGPSS